LIKTFNYFRTLATIEEEVMEAFRRVLHSGHLMLGPETKAFEKEFAEFTGAMYCIGVSSGTTALHLALMALGIGPGDEVITVANTCAPTVAAIELCGATPVFVDVRDEDLMIDANRIREAITGRTKCIIPVHLWGQCVDIEAVLDVAKEARLLVVEDCAQAQGTEFKNKHVGVFGNAGCFSFYPTKNLGAYGDAGAVVTDDDELAERLGRMRMYGYDEEGRSVEKGMNARISEVQAAVLRVKLGLLPQWLDKRKQIAAYYDNNLANSGVTLPARHNDRAHSFHQYVVRSRIRREIIDAFKNKGIGFGIHYPIPLHFMPAYKGVRRFPKSLYVTEAACEEILSLPIHEALLTEEAEQVVTVIKGLD
jgi:aminotransferase EvaB